MNKVIRKRDKAGIRVNIEKEEKVLYLNHDDADIVKYSDSFDISLIFG